MKSLRVKFFFSLLIIVTNIISYGQTNRIYDENNSEINKIFVQFFPCFIEYTQVLVDIQSKEITFYRFGGKEKWYPPSDPADSLKPGYNPDVYIKKMPTPLNVKLNNKEFNYLMDSIILQINSTDLKDSISDCCTDGITVILFTTFKNGNLKETELANYFSKIHLRFFNFLLDILHRNSLDSTTEVYLNKLKKYFD